MKNYSAVMCVLDDDMGKNGLEYGITANCRRFLIEFQAVNISEAKSICEDIGVIYDGEIIATFDEDDWWKK